MFVQDGRRLVPLEIHLRQDFVIEALGIDVYQVDRLDSISIENVLQRQTLDGLFYDIRAYLLAKRPRDVRPVERAELVVPVWQIELSFRLFRYVVEGLGSLFSPDRHVLEDEPLRFAVVPAQT